MWTGVSDDKKQKSATINNNNCMIQFWMNSCDDPICAGKVYFLLKTNSSTKVRSSSQDNIVSFQIQTVSQHLDPVQLPTHATMTVPVAQLATRQTIDRKWFCRAGSNPNRSWNFLFFLVFSFN